MAWLVPRAGHGAPLMSEPSSEVFPGRQRGLEAPVSLRLKSALEGLRISISPALSYRLAAQLSIAQVHSLLSYHIHLFAYPSPSSSRATTQDLQTLHS